jgi:hypothetical protein
MHKRSADGVNKWATFHGLLAAVAFTGVAAFPGSKWPLMHHLWTCLFFFDAVCYMQVSVRIDQTLQQLQPLLQAGAW